MSGKQLRLEDPVRVKELNPVETLKRVGLQEDDVLCDIGAGSGIFSLAAAGITKNKIYALDIDEEMLAIIRGKMEIAGVNNIEPVKVADAHWGIPDQTVDMALMVTVLHEIDPKTDYLKEVKRILKRNGKFVAIEFHKRETPMGPPVKNRLGKDEITGMLANLGFHVRDEFDMGANLYCLVFLSPGL